jgi:hypothetical protein
VPVDDKRVTYRTSEHDGAVATALMKSKHVEEFREVLRRVLQNLRPSEVVTVYWWFKPFVYVEVRDLAWKHYPCYMRLLVSFDIENGQAASRESSNRYAFARKGWYEVADALVGRKVTRYSDCGRPEKARDC